MVVEPLIVDDVLDPGPSIISGPATSDSMSVPSRAIVCDMFGPKTALSNSIWLPAVLGSIVGLADDVGQRPHVGSSARAAVGRGDDVDRRRHAVSITRSSSHSSRKRGERLGRISVVSPIVSRERAFSLVAASSLSSQGVCRNQSHMIERIAASAGPSTVGHGLSSSDPDSERKFIRRSTRSTLVTAPIIFCPTKLGAAYGSNPANAITFPAQINYLC